jgi:hypothetical protein
MTKVTFNGTTKRIVINNGVTSLDVELDIYSAWKAWVLIGDNSKYLQAMSTVGGDPLPGGLAVGNYYFLENGWKLVPPNDGGSSDIQFNGNLFSADGSDVFDVSGFGGTFRAIRQVVSSLSEIISTGGSALTPTESTMLLELYRVLGLDPTKPLLVKSTGKYADTIVQTFTENPDGSVTVTRR